MSVSNARHRQRESVTGIEFSVWSKVRSDVRRLASWRLCRRRGGYLDLLRFEVPGLDGQCRRQGPQEERQIFQAERVAVLLLLLVLVSVFVFFCVFVRVSL